MAPLIVSTFPAASQLEASVLPLIGPAAPRTWPHASSITSIVQMAITVTRRFTGMYAVSGSTTSDNIIVSLMCVSSTSSRRRHAAPPCAAPSTSRCVRTSVVSASGGGWGKHRGVTTIDHISALRITNASVLIGVARVISAKGPRRVPTVWPTESGLWRAAARPNLARMAESVGLQAAAGSATSLIHLVGVRNVILLTAVMRTTRPALGLWLRTAGRWQSHAADGLRLLLMLVVRESGTMRRVRPALGHWLRTAGR